MMEPQKVVGADDVPMKSSTRLPAGIGLATPNAKGLSTDRGDNRVRPRGPRPSTSPRRASGIWVISTRLATNQPADFHPRRQGGKCEVDASLATARVTATAMDHPRDAEAIASYIAESGVGKAFDARMKDHAGRQVEAGRSG